MTINVKGAAWALIVAYPHHEATKASKRHSRNRTQLCADMAVVEVLANREEFAVSSYEGERRDGMGISALLSRTGAGLARHDSSW